MGSFFEKNTGDFLPRVQQLNEAAKAAGITPGSDQYYQLAKQYGIDKPRSWWDENKLKLGVAGAFALPVAGLALGAGGGAAAAGAGGSSALLGGIGDFIGSNTFDNILKGVGVGAQVYGASQQGKAADEQLDFQKQQYADEKARYDDALKRRAGAAKAVSPYLRGIMDELRTQRRG